MSKVVNLHVCVFYRCIIILSPGFEKRLCVSSLWLDYVWLVS